MALQNIVSILSLDWNTDFSLVHFVTTRIGPTKPLLTTLGFKTALTTHVRQIINHENESEIPSSS